MTVSTSPQTDLGRVLVVDDHQFVAQGLVTALRADGFDASIARCDSAETILDDARDFDPDVVVLDLQLAQAGDGTDLIQPLISLGADVLMLTGVTDREELAECLEAGAIGVVSKAEAFGSLLEKVRCAAAGEMVTPVTARAQYLAELRDNRTADRARRAPFESLTRREAEVLRLIVDGISADTIARSQFVSLATVRTQIRSILQKLEVRSQLEAAALARASGWEGPHE
jgi:DNA-binding NarL/FixJ family response regulator